MACHLRKAWIDVRLMAARFRDNRLRIIRHHYLDAAVEELKGKSMTSAPCFAVFLPKQPGVCIATCTQGTDKQVGESGVTCSFIYDA